VGTKGEEGSRRGSVILGRRKSPNTVPVMPHSEIIPRGYPEGPLRWIGRTDRRE